MTSLQIGLLCLGIILFLSICVYLYGYLFEVKKTRIIRFHYHFKQLTKIKKPINNHQTVKVLFFSDLHIGKILKGKKLKNKIDFILKQNADIYLFGGDLIGYKTAKYFKKQDIEDLFKRFDDKLCFKVNGNHEFKKEKGITQEEKDILSLGMTFKKLENEETVLTIKNKTFSIIGLQEGQYHQPLLPKNLNESDYKIVMVHQGDYFDNINGVDIVLSGHTHGGQIRLPFCPPIYNPKHGKKYLKGAYKKNQQLLIVSKGIGCNMLNYRFLAPSDIIELYID